MILQPGAGPIRGRHYLPSDPTTVAWGWLPRAGTEPVLEIDSGDTLTIDTISHEGLLEEFGRDPVEWFGRHGVAAGDVLTDGIRIACAGRLGGSEIARREWYRDGRVPLHTIRADIDFGMATAHTTAGTIGVKVWIFKGEVLRAAPPEA